MGFFRLHRLPRMATAELNRIARYTPLDPAKFNIIHDVPIFDEHEVEELDPETGEQRTLRYSKDVLEAMCETMNRRIEATGDYTAICLGHTPTPTERQRGVPQPPLVGFCGPFYVGTIDEETPRPAIIAKDWGIFHDEVDRARKHPRRSVEVWREPDIYERYVEPIALLGAETPRRDLGLAYSMRHQGVQVSRYTASCPVAPSGTNTFIPGGKSRRQYEKPETATEGASMLSDEDINKIIAAVMELDTTKFVQQLMEQQQAKAPDTVTPPGADPAAAGAPGAPGAPGDPAAMAGPDMGAPDAGGDMGGPDMGADMGGPPDAGGPPDMGGDDSLPPDFGGPEAEPDEDEEDPDAVPKDRNAGPESEDDMPPVKDDKDQYRRSRADQQRYAQIERYNRKLAADNAELSKRLKAIEHRHTLAERYSKIDAMAGVVTFDTAEEYARVEGMNEAQFDSHMELMRSHYQKDPTGFAPLPRSKPRQTGTDDKTLYAKIEQRANSYVSRGVYKTYEQVEQEIRKEMNGAAV